MSLIETARRIFRKSALKQYPLRARLAVERLEDRTVPTTYFTWNGGYANNDFDDARNWYQGGTGPLPAASDSINFVNDPVTNVANPCNNFHAASGPYYAITVNFSSTVTLSTAITTQTFNMQKGNTSQDADGEDITVTASFGWTFGNINISSYSGNLNLTKGNPWMWSATSAPSGGTVNTGNSIKLFNGAVATVYDGTINMTNAGVEIEVNQNCSFNVDPGAGLSAFITGFSKDFRIKPSGTLALRSGFWTFPGQVTNQGTFTLKAETTANIFGARNENVPDSYYAYQQSGGATYLYGSSTLNTIGAVGIKISGGVLATKYAATDNSPNDCSATINTQKLYITGGDIYIGYGGSHVAFGTLSCIGVVEWSGGTYHPSVRSYGGPGGLGEADLWQSTGVFNVNGGGALAPIVVDAEGAVVYQPPSGVTYVLLKSDASFDTNINPSFDASVWDIDKITVGGVVKHWNLRAL